MPARERELMREELRALLVLGIIGTLLGARDFLSINLGLGLHVSDLTNNLMLYWGMYVFLMAIGISDDWINERVVRFCAIAAEVVFGVGIALTVSMALFIGIALMIGLVYPSFVNSWLGVVLVAIPIFVLVLVIHGAIVKKSTRSPKVRKKGRSNEENKNGRAKTPTEH